MSTPRWALKMRAGSPPKDVVSLGRQASEPDEIYSVVAITEWGLIPGKATKNGTCWYPHGGKEILSEHFYWLCVEPGFLIRTEVSNGSGPPANAVKDGYQTDGHGDLYAALANDGEDKIPGKAEGDTCWYSYGGVEKTTKNFSWVVMNEFP